VDESGSSLELKWGRSVDQKMTAVHGTLCTIPPVTSKFTHILVVVSLIMYHPVQQSIYKLICFA
jgi:hypothetical protein